MTHDSEWGIGWLGCEDKKVVILIRQHSRPDQETLLIASEYSYHPFNVIMTNKVSLVLFIPIMSNPCT